jgi:nucleotide-binding universal stress UspA family protein
MRKQWRSVQKNYLPKYNKLWRSKELSIDVIGNKSVPKGIIDYARKSGVDVIVIGTKGLTGVEKFLMGSAVIDHAHCPVVAIR